MMDDTANKTVTRRAMLIGSFTVGSALFLGGTLPAMAISSLPKSHGPLANGKPFLMLSSLLTGHENLDENLGKALFTTLNQAGYGNALNILYDEIVQAGNNSKAISAAAEKHSKVTRALLRGWYVGLVRMKDGKDKLVGYQQTLMGKVVNDFIPLRSNCGGAPHFWAEPPKLADLPV